MHQTTDEIDVDMKLFFLHIPKCILILMEEKYSFSRIFFGNFGLR